MELIAMRGEERQSHVEFQFPELLARLILESSGDYVSEKRDSERIDEFLELQISEIEHQLQQAIGRAAASQEAWQHLSPQVFQTPYAEIYRILQALAPKPGELVVDLGAAYGRMAFVLESFFPEVRFVGYELLEARVFEARRVLSRLRLQRSCVEVCDLENPQFKPVQAQHYFLYDFGTRSAIRKALLDLRDWAREGQIQVVARGRAARDEIEREHPWLSQVNQPRHWPHYSLYCS
ncbi:MAG: hypothetical protein RJB38_2237 [Pseudomonadota bacterium]|jgi:hypothetical protein